MPLSIQRLTLVTDAWHPQVNGVVTTLTQLVNHLREMGVEVDVIQPNDYATIATPTYPEIPLVWRAKGLKQRILDFKPDALHIATEGALGLRARRIALQLHWPFTSAYHTKYPEYLAKRFPIPKRWVYAWLRRFHRPATTTFAPAQAIIDELHERGFEHLQVMSRGVDQILFNPNQARPLPFPKPIYLYVGRIAVEKNLDAFLSLDLDGSKVLVGDGPAKHQLSARYPNAHFVGAQHGETLAQFYAGADVMVFPSLTDTFGLVNIEAMACGTPVAAFPVTGPIDIIQPGVNGEMDDDLALAIARALKLERTQIAPSVAHYNWHQVSQTFLQQLAPITRPGHIETFA